MAQSEYAMTIEQVREIAATSGIPHAEFCVEQAETQLGDTYAAPLKAEIAHLWQEEWAANEKSLRDVDLEVEGQCLTSAPR